MSGAQVRHGRPRKYNDGYLCVITPRAKGVNRLRLHGNGHRRMKTYNQLYTREVV